MVSVIKPDWPAPETISAYSTTRLGGHSDGNYAGFNLATGIKDKPNAVRKNRALLKQKLALPREPLWLNQVHGVNVIDANPLKKRPKADAVFTNTSGIVCVTLTADCLPLLICNTQGNCVAAIHAGWRGLANGIIEATLSTLAIKPKDTLAWLGPAIGPTAFEVGKDVYTTFVDMDNDAKEHFCPTKKDHWLANIYGLAKQRLAKCHVTQVYGGNYCTYTEKERFFSYRRDKECGRMATMIWFDEPK